MIRKMKRLEINGNICLVITKNNFEKKQNQ